jgi:WS/DGAT/MGAT family acyltransferase
MGSRKLEGIDSAFLAVETDAAPMHMTGVVTLEPAVPGRPASFDEIRSYLEERLQAIPVFRRHLAEVPLGLDHPSWVEGGFDPDAHLRRIAVPEPGGPAELCEVVGHLAAVPLDRRRPLWEIWVIEGLARDRTALVAKIHHALMDGVAGAGIFARLFDFDGGPEAPAADSGAPGPARGEPPPQRARLAAAARSWAARPYRLARQMLASAAAAARGFRAAAGSAPPESESLLTAPDTPLNGAITSRREVALGSVSLAEVEQIKRGLEATVNDVVLALCTGALRRHLIRTAGAVDEPLVAAVPVSIARDPSRHTAGNAVSVMSVELPVHLADPVSRITRIQRSAVRSKRAHRAIGGGLLAGWAELVPPAVLSGVTDLYSRLDLADRHRPLANLVVSNVRGPRGSLRCAGHRVQACYPMGPIYEGTALNLTVLSYDGRLHFGLLACPDVVTGLDQLAAGLADGVTELLRVARRRPESAPDAAGARAREAQAAPPPGRRALLSGEARRQVAGGRCPDGG